MQTSCPCPPHIDDVMEKMTLDEAVECMRGAGDTFDRFFGFIEMKLHDDSMTSVLLELCEKLLTVANNAFQEELDSAQEKFIFDNYDTCNEIYEECDNYWWKIQRMSDSHTFLNNKNEVSFKKLVNLLDEIRNVLFNLKTIKQARTEDKMRLLYQKESKAYFNSEKCAHHLNTYLNNLMDKKYLSVMTLDNLYSEYSDTRTSFIKTDAGKLWDNCSEEDLPCKLHGLNMSEKDFMDFLQTRARLQRLKELMNKKKAEGESDVFEYWVDVDKLQDVLEPTIKVHIDKQYKWAVVYSVMKYLEIIKSNVAIKIFCKRMDSMFPRNEVKCDYESIRKLATNPDRWKHVDEWPADDKDLEIAKIIHERLRNKDKYTKGRFPV